MLCYLALSVLLILPHARPEDDLTQLDLTKEFAEKEQSLLEERQKGCVWSGWGSCTKHWGAVQNRCHRTYRLCTQGKCRKACVVDNYNQQIPCRKSKKCVSGRQVITTKTRSCDCWEAYANVRTAFMRRRPYWNNKHWG